MIQIRKYAHRVFLFSVPFLLIALLTETSVAPVLCIIYTKFKPVFAVFENVWIFILLLLSDPIKVFNLGPLIGSGV